MNSRAIIVVLLLGNVALATTLFLVNRRPAGEAQASAPVQTAGPAHPKTRLSGTNTVLTLTTNDFNWASVESEDYRIYIANLRSIGVPEETLRDIIIADVNKLFARRVAALYPGPEDFKYWQVEDKTVRENERKREQQRRDLEKEKRALIKELLGVDYETELARWSGRPDEESWRLGFLSSEKQQQIQTLQAKYRELTRALWGDGSGGRTADARAKLTALRAQQDAEMAQILGPQDYEQYQLRNSPVARSMRDNLSSFQPTEDEFRKIFDLRRKLEEQNSGARGEERLTGEERQAAEQKVESEMKAALGDDRFAQYQLSQDERYRSLNQFAERNNVPKETVDAVYEMRRAAEDALKQVESNPNLAPDVRQATLQALAEETRRSVSQKLGDNTWKEYQRREGSWIDRLGRGENNRGNPDGRQRYLRR